MAGRVLRLRALWGRLPENRIEVLLLWVCGLAFGAFAFWSTRDLPLPVALACWAAVAGLGLGLALCAEPILWEAATPDPESPAAREPDPPPSPRIPPLLDLVQVPGGTFRMGSPPATEGQIAAFARDWAEALDKQPQEAIDDVRRWLEREQPAHQVRLSPFLMARVPVTRGQWWTVLSAGPEEWSQTGDDADLPATHVDWPQSLAFCNALSAREGLTPCYRKDEQGEWQWDRTADGYRLPTEAEWESACRAGAETQWFWGDDPAGAEKYAWYRGNAGGSLKPVRSKAANPWGLHDMAGLVFEWCWDRFATYPGETEPPTLDPVGPEEGDSRVVRGGSFDDPPVFLRSAFRVVGRPVVRADALGLRCVRSRARQP